MERLNYNTEVFDEGVGKIYWLLNRIAMPAMVIGVLMIAVINTGGMTGFASAPDWVKILFMLVIALYVVPSLFIFPTSWMLRSWKTSSLRDNYVMAGKRSVEYHKISDKVGGSMKENVYVATQIKKVEETKRKYIIKGNILEKSTGNVSGELEIPKAFDNMELIKRAARYR